MPMPIYLSIIAIVVYFLSTSAERSYTKIILAVLKILFWFFAGIVKIIAGIFKIIKWSLSYVIEEWTPRIVLGLIFLYMLYSFIKIGISSTDPQLLKSPIFVTGNEVSNFFLSLAGFLAFYELLERRKQERKKN